jgi:hypothetical protein
MSTISFSKFSDTIDSRDIIARIDELNADREEIDDEERAELDILESLADEASGSPDWRYGETLIRDSYFEDYAQDLARDCGMIPDDLRWPCTCIDWEQAARELRMGYFSVDFDGMTFWVRG